MSEHNNSFHAARQQKISQLSVFIALSIRKVRVMIMKTCKNSPRLSKRLHCCVGGQRADQTDDLCQDGRQQEV